MLDLGKDLRIGYLQYLKEGVLPSYLKEVEKVNKNFFRYFLKDILCRRGVFGTFNNT